jgi:hypothetical protein
MTGGMIVANNPSVDVVLKVTGKTLIRKIGKHYRKILAIITLCDNTIQQDTSLNRKIEIGFRKRLVC